MHMLCDAQIELQQTMFMYNKLLYNPGYTGSREVTSFNALYRRQWSDIIEAPRFINLSLDAPLGTYMRPFRSMAAGFSMCGEVQDVERYMMFRGYYAYRLQLPHSTVLSLGMSGGINLYSATYTNAHIGTYDPAFKENVRSAIMPNFGAGVYWSGENFYAGLSVPNMLQEYYDRYRGRLTSKQIRTYYLSGGYSFAVSNHISLQPQMVLRAGVNGKYRMPLNADINMSVVAYKRFMAGLSYRTNGAIAGIVHVQATKRLNIGYAHELPTGRLAGYGGSTYEVMVGIDAVRDNFKFLTPRFIRKF